MTDSFAPNSRYYNSQFRSRARADGETETFVARRIIPTTDRFTIHDRVVTDDQSRIDTIAAEALGDAELYWRICDANGEADPTAATKPAGRLLAIPLPIEVSGNDT